MASEIYSFDRDLREWVTVNKIAAYYSEINFVSSNKEKSQQQPRSKKKGKRKNRKIFHHRINK